MLVAISGSQGSGKTTVLNQLKSIGFPIVERKTSRSILEDWNVTLFEVNNDHELTIKFQDEILKRKYEDELEAVNSKDIWFTERTYADLFTYTLISLGKDNPYSDFVDSYFLKCKEKQNVYSAVFYLNAGMFTIEHDGVRGSNKHYSKMVDLIMSDFTRQMTPSNKLITVEEADVAGRVFTIYRELSKLFPLQFPLEHTDDYDNLVKLIDGMDQFDDIFKQVDKVFAKADETFEEADKMFDEVSEILRKSDSPDTGC